MHMTYDAGIQDTLVHALDRAVAQSSDSLFIDVDGDRLDYRAFNLRVNCLARALQQLGVEKGATVLSILDTSLDVVTLWFALSKLGAVWVPVNTAYRGEFLRHQATDSCAFLAICDEPYLENLVRELDEIPNVQRILCRSNGPFPECSVPIEPFDLHRGSDPSPLPIVVGPGDLAAVIYTSGTTGPSKGCMLSHNYMCEMGRQQLLALPLEKGEVGWTCLPMFHLAALQVVMASLMGAHRAAVWSRFSVSSFWEDVEKSEATTALLMASIFPLVAQAPDSAAMKRCYGKLKYILGIPISAELRAVWKERFGVQFLSSFSYGQTEGGRLATCYPHETPPEGSAGHLTEAYEVMIFDDDDRPVRDGEVGEIVFRPRHPHIMFEGFWRNPEATRAVWKNLWMHTGDLGLLEGEWLYFVDRKKDYLRARGENIASFEIERTFMQHPEVSEVAAHAVGVQSGEDEVKVTIVRRSGATIAEREICLWCIDRLPYFAVPRFIEFRSNLPKTASMKVQKHVLRDEGVTASTWDRTAEGIDVRRPRTKGSSNPQAARNAVGA